MLLSVLLKVIFLNLEAQTRPLASIQFEKIMNLSPDLVANCLFGGEHAFLVKNNFW